MPNNFARHEQFLRIFALLDTLSEARQPLDDQALIAAIRDRLGLSRLSPRTLRRDCEFLASCGYPVEHKPVAGSRRFGWQIDREAAGSRRLPAEPLTLLELVALNVARDLLRDFEGTVLWTGIETLREKIERGIPAGLRSQLEEAKRIFHVAGRRPARYASRPRLLSTLSAAITDRREIDLAERDGDGKPTPPQRLQPHCLVIDPVRVELLAFPPDTGDTTAPVFIDIERIDNVVPTDTTFPPCPTEAAELVARRAT